MNDVIAGMMWLQYILAFFGLSAVTCWIHDGKVIGLDIVQNGVLPVNYMFVQLVDFYGRK